MNPASAGLLQRRIGAGFIIAQEWIDASKLNGYQRMYFGSACESEFWSAVSGHHSQLLHCPFPGCNWNCAWILGLPSLNVFAPYQTTVYAPISALAANRSPHR